MRRSVVVRYCQAPWGREGRLKTNLSIASIWFVAMTLAAHAASPPASNFLVVDRAALLEQSKTGQDIIRQVKAATDEVDKDLSVRNASLQTERGYLQQRLAVIPPQFRAKEIKDFDAKQKDLQDLSRQKQAMIQAGFVKARSQIELLLAPILLGLMKQRGADMLIDKKYVVMSNERALDVTDAAIARLNAKISSLKVDFVPVPSAGAKH